MDIPSWVEGRQVLLRSLPTETAPEALIFSAAGCLGLNGINAQGVGITCNTLAQLHYARDGLPVMFVLRSVLEQNTIDAAEHFPPFYHPCIRAKLYRFPRRVICAVLNVVAIPSVAISQTMQRGRVFHSNHPLANQDRSDVAVHTEHRLKNSQARMQSMENRLGDTHKTMGLEDIKAALSAHDDPQNPVSRQLNKENQTNTIGYTAGASIYEFSASPILHLAAGPACETPLRAVHLHNPIAKQRNSHEYNPTKQTSKACRYHRRSLRYRAGHCASLFNGRVIRSLSVTLTPLCSIPCCRKIKGYKGVIADVGNPQQVEAFIEQAINLMGSIDVLVNNAGIGGPKAAIEDIDYQDWDDCIRINLSGMFYCAKQVIPAMKKQGSGCIINISTGSAKTGLPKRLPYVASKVGVLGLSHNLARELGEFNIRCNTILPGLMDNPRGRSLVAKHAEENQLTIEQAEAEFLKYSSMRCWIQPAEIADAALFLASDGAKHITAQEIAVDGNFEWEQ